MTGLIVQIIASVLVKLVVKAWENERLRAAAFAEVERTMAQAAFAAFAFKERAAAAPDGGATLRVRDGADAIVSGPDTGLDHAPPGGDVPPPERGADPVHHPE